MSRELKVEFAVENDAFAGKMLESECGRILLDMLRKINHGGEGGPIFDINGNRVGQWTLDRDDG